MPDDWAPTRMTWGIVGLLHDFDYERWPDPPDHPLQGAAILAERGYPQHVIYAIKSHADYLTDCPRVSPLDKALYACDELAGFITAVAARAARGHSRHEAVEREKETQAKELRRGGESRRHHRAARADLGVDLDEHIQAVIDAMTTIATESDLNTGSG